MGKYSIGKKNRIIAIPDNDTGYEMIKKAYNKGRMFCLDYKGYMKKCKKEDQPKVD